MAKPPNQNENLNLNLDYLYKELAAREKESDPSSARKGKDA